MSVSNSALTTLDSVKEWSEMTGSKQSADDLIETLIDNITVEFENYCGVDSFKQADYTEYYDGSEGIYIFVKNVPINSVAGIWIDQDWSWEATDLVDSDDYRINQDNRFISSLNGWTSGVQNIKVTYNAGYSTIPGDLGQVCNEEVYRRYKKNKEIDVMIKTLEDGSLHYPSPRLLDSTVMILSKYKRMRAL